MINAGMEDFSPVLDQVTRGGRGSVARTLGAFVTKHGEVATPLHRAFGAIARGSQSINEGRYEEALNVMIPALEELERSAFNKRLGWLHAMVGFAVGMMGNPERGLEWTSRAVAELELVPASVDNFTAYSNQGCLLGMVGEHDASKEMLERALDFAIATGNLGSQHIALSNISYGLLIKLQESELLSAAQKRSLAIQALKYAERAKELCSGEALGLDPGGIDSLLGQAMLHAGDVARARTMFAQALQSGLANPGESVEAHLGMAMALRMSEEFDDARVHLRTAHEVATSRQLGLVLDRVMAEGAILENAAGDLKAALDWTHRRCNFLEKHYKQRLQLLARSTELATQADSVSLNASRYQKEAESLISRSRDWDDERLRDALTDTFNRKGLARVAGHIFAPFRELATVVIDIDNFSSINDSYGRPTGDILLRRVASIIASHLRNADQFGRAEGAEFQLLLLDSLPDATFATCEQIRTAIEHGQWLPSHPEAKVTVSIGICNRSSEKNFEATLAAADQALERAKKFGGNRTHVAQLIPAQSSSPVPVP